MRDVKLINAGAGSGKTFELTSRMVEALESGIEPEALMATTYTVRAASELRERIRLGLLAKGRFEEAQGIYDGFIGTLHSICGRLLTEYAIEAGLSPALNVLPEEDAEHLFRRATTEAIEGTASTIEPAALRLGYDGGGTGYQQRSDWRQAVQEIVSAARFNRIDKGSLERFADASLESLFDLLGPEGNRDPTDRFRREVERAVQEISQVADPLKTTQAAIVKLRAVAEGLKRPERLPWADWVRTSKLKANKTEEDILEGPREISAGVLGHPALREDLRVLVRGVFGCAGEALESYQRFKRQQGLMDFVDQERLVLELACENPVFRAALEDRLAQVMVDEFQDTSPIQLGLFLRLHILAGRSIWVGDPKQSIYGFRGTDPELMEEVTRRIPEPDNLLHSWRSRDRLVDVCNAVFSQVFRESEGNPVSLRIPEQRRQSAAGGWVEAWNLCARNGDQESAALAAGVRELLSRQPALRPGDVAILCRTHDDRKRLATNLETLGIRASASKGSLVDTLEGRLALAALQYLHDPRDTVALATIVRISPDHASHDGWLQQLLENSEGAVSCWQLDPRVKSLDEARGLSSGWTPQEAMEEAINRVGLPEAVQGWGNTAVRMGNLDLLRGLGMEYLDRCGGRRRPATLAGLLSHLEGSESGESEGTGADTVQILTYHAAKGLEWPVVILTGLDKGPRANVFGPGVVPAPDFDPGEPLANRSIRFWPWPFGSQGMLPELEERLAGRPEMILAESQATNEARRLLYVGMTRARDGMVFAIRREDPKSGSKLKTAWLDELKDAAGERLLDWPMQTGEQTLSIGGRSLQITVHEHSWEDGGEANGSGNGGADTIWRAPMVPARTWPPARITASGAAAHGEVLVISTTDLGPRIPIQQGTDVTRLGNAIHGFMAAASSDAGRRRQEEMASGLLNRWEVEGALGCSDLLSIWSRLDLFMNTHFPSAKRLREWPVTLRTPEHQVMQGWIDLLLETPEGFVIIDHKSFPGAGARQRATESAPQLFLYRKAVEAATGRPVLATLIHFPLLGKMVEVGEVRSGRGEA